MERTVSRRLHEPSERVGAVKLTKFLPECETRPYYNARMLPRGLVSLFLFCASICSGQVVTSLHPAASFPGDWLQFRGDRKLTGRSRLVGNITPPAVTHASAPGLNLDALPKLTYSSVVVNLSTTTLGSEVVQNADVAFQNISTSEGLSYPKFGFFMLRAVGSTTTYLQFRPDQDPNLAGVAGLTPLGWVVDTVYQTVQSPNLGALPPNLQHLLLAIVANLATIYGQASQVVTASKNAGPVWTIGDATTLATSISNLIAGPSPILWRQYLGARQTSVALQLGGSATSIVLPAADSNAGALAANATWGIGLAGYDLNHNGQPLFFGLDSATKIGNFVAGSNSFQKVEFDSAFQTCGNNADTCSQFGHLYQWQNGNWVEQWVTPPILSLFAAQTIVGDFDGDGRLEVAVEPWYNMQVYDLLTGQMKTSAQFTPQGAESGRGYGWSGAVDLNGDGTRELIALGTFQNFIAVMGWQNGQLVKLWDHLIEASVEARRTVHVSGAFPVQDIDGDGKYEIVTSIYNESGDGQWHVVARDGMTGAVVLDEPGRFLLGMTDINGDGAADLFTMAASGLAIPSYGQIDVMSFHGRTAQTLLELTGSGIAVQPLQQLPLNVNSSDQLSNVVAGPIVSGGLPVFFTTQLVDQSSGTVGLTAWQWSNGACVKLGTITGPNLQVAAIRAAAPGSPVFLVTGAVRGDSSGSISGTGLSGTVVQSSLISAPLSSAVVARLRPGDPPTVITQDALEDLVAFRPSSATGTGKVLWTHPGRGGTMGSDSSNGQYGYDGPLLASLAGDGTLQAIAATRGPSGLARVTAIQPDGTDLWSADLARFPGAPPAWNQPGVTLLFAGRFRSPDHEDVLAATRRGAEGSEELNLLDGLSGQLVWNDPNGNTPGSSYNQRGAGEGQMAIYDWNGDGLDEMVNEQTDVFWVKDGNDKNLIDGVFAYDKRAVFGNLPVYYGVPAVADFLNNGTDTILYGASTYMLGLLSPQATAIWQGGFEAGTPAFLQGIADLDGDGTLSLVNAGVGNNGQSTLSVMRAGTGKTLWSIPLPGCGQFLSNQNWTGNAPTPVTVGDINGDGRDEAVFACGTRIYVVGANPGNLSGRILWTLDLGTMLDTPVLADAEGNGQLEIVVVGSNGYVYGIGSLPSTAPPAPDAPVIAANGVVEGATFRPGQVAPGGWFTVEGSNLSNGKYQAGATPLPQQLGGTVVTVNGQIARLNYADSGQINAEMPPDIPAGPASVVVRTSAGISKSASLQIVPAMPEIFQYGANRAVAQNAADYSLNAPGNAVSAGDALVVYFTGAGLVNGDRRTGVPAPSSPLMQVSLPATVTIGGQPAQAAFLGLTPGSIGLCQANVTVPPGLTPGDYPITITIGGVTSSPAQISVK